MVQVLHLPVIGVLPKVLQHDSDEDPMGQFVFVPDNRDIESAEERELNRWRSFFSRFQPDMHVGS